MKKLFYIIFSAHQSDFIFLKWILQQWIEKIIFSVLMEIIMHFANVNVDKAVHNG